MKRPTIKPYFGNNHAGQPDSLTIKPEVFALRFISAWSGDAPADHNVGGSFTRADLETRTVDSTYDGVSARTKGRIEIVTLKIPASIKTLVEKGAIFAPTNSEWIGCWCGDQPHRLGKDEWTWNSEEYAFLTATAYANGFEFDGTWERLEAA